MGNEKLSKVTCIYSEKTDNFVSAVVYECPYNTFLFAEER
jgi:hypothetical protein